jgi:hypothetical protein
MAKSSALLVRIEPRCRRRCGRKRSRSCSAKSAGSATAREVSSIDSAAARIASPYAIASMASLVRSIVSFRLSG